jgi:hypothetical protein
LRADQRLDFAKEVYRALLPATRAEALPDRALPGVSVGVVEETQRVAPR